MSFYHFEIVIEKDRTQIVMMKLICADQKSARIMVSVKSVCYVLN